jgi:hypothetical protein
VKTKIIVKLIMLGLITVGLNGCVNSRYYRQPLTTTEFERQTETTTDVDGKTSTKVITNEYIKTEPPPQSRYYYSGGNYYPSSGRSYRGRRNAIRVCLFGCGDRDHHHNHRNNRQHNFGNRHHH